MVDMSDMHSMVKNFPSLLTSYRIESETRETCIRLGDEGIGGILILGMGGSAIAGLYVQSLFRHSAPIPILTNQDYTLPAYVDSNWIIIAVSYSGNTEETLAAYDESVNRGCQTFIIASGGELYTKGNSLSKIKIVDGYQPRAAFPLIFPIVLNLVECVMGLKPTELGTIANSLSKKALEWENSSLAPKRLAQDIIGIVPLFIGSRNLVPVAYRAKCQINENAKTMAFFSEVPEANHNEIESFISGNEFKILPIFIRSSYEDIKIKKRMNITARLYKEEGYSPVSLSIEGSNKVEEMLAFTFYLDLVSVELAKIREVNPLTVEQISKLKNELN
ncbi:MAG: hypothetical protein AM326_05530 [Candidatus Thorarchaeota archaeon SMTZ-45]|nr:MAG: hypothetical protein AM325_03675 [Candidatus Thorarchaeota archaeon SMTZ1-45]KXH77173.1 MAG: hypothetical protein AM326_05530 [Candidatus Thorarchaeota archaeon SMTZ-45]